MKSISVASIDIDIPSLLVGVGAGVAGVDLLANTLLAGASLLTVGGAVLAFGYLTHKYGEE